MKSADRLGRPSPANERKGKGFHQPSRAHRHWHIDFSHLNVCGTFYHLCSVLDGYSRSVVHWEVRETMFEQDAEIVVQRARERFPGECPRIISDNGPQFVAKNFRELVQVIIEYGPSAIEILEPSKSQLSMSEAQDVLNNVAGMMHRYAAAGLGGTIIVRGKE